MISLILLLKSVRIFLWSCWISTYENAVSMYIFEWYYIYYQNEVRESNVKIISYHKLYQRKLEFQGPSQDWNRYSDSFWLYRDPANSDGYFIYRLCDGRQWSSSYSNFDPMVYWSAHHHVVRHESCFLA